MSPELWNSRTWKLQDTTPSPLIATSPRHQSHKGSEGPVSLCADLRPRALRIQGPLQFGKGTQLPPANEWFPDKYLQHFKPLRPPRQTPGGCLRLPLVREVYDAGDQDPQPHGTTLTGRPGPADRPESSQSLGSTFKDDNNSNPWIFNELAPTPSTSGRLEAKINADSGDEVAIRSTRTALNHILEPSPKADNLGVFGSQGVFAPTSGRLRHVFLRPCRLPRVRGFDGPMLALATLRSRLRPALCERGCLREPGQHHARPGCVRSYHRSTSAKVTAINGQALPAPSLYQITASSARDRPHPARCSWTNDGKRLVVTISLPR